MTNTRSIVLASLSAMMLTACGSSEAEPPAEQIIVREPGTPAPVAAQASDAATDLVALGEAAFAVCSACHSAEQGAASRIGPNLYGVVGREAGAYEGFANYSDAMKASGITWDEGQLNAFIANPSSAVSGTTMVAGAVSDAETRAAIIAYLTSLSE
ncbi:c-type cytochrome [Erythrobacter sp. W53]|uniref:c-type cytochrome n=1 Tax=Erythrobacter sp. W53 TaxID=3425947 RepID=UPI003D768EF0